MFTSNCYRPRTVQKLLRGSSLEDVHTDEAGNLTAVRAGMEGGRCLVVAAHLDTVFPPDVAPRVVRTGRRGQILKAPGIADNAGGIAALLAIIEALDRGGIRTRDDVVFAWTVGEEALGNLRGVRHLLRSASLRKRLSGFVALDGANPRKLVTSGPAIRRYRVTFRSRGGHSWGRFGVPSPIHAAGRLIARLASVRVPSRPKTTFNVGVVSDGDRHEARAGMVVTAVPATAAIEVDLRSEQAGALGRLEAAFRAALERALEEERRHATQDAASLRAGVECIGARPAGRTPRNSTIVRAALASYARFGMPLVCVCNSTDSTYPMSLGIPSVTIPQGGRGRGTHTLEERINIAGRERAIKAALMLVVRLAVPA
jgi:acetylornithine deacetylase/succinyl-diaminopimelate desuccinylase-like protein